MTYRVIVTGSRKMPYGLRYLVWSQLSHLIGALQNPLEDEFTVVHGACPTGTDSFVPQWVTSMHPLFPNVHEEPHPADWQFNGKQAGMYRNQAMADLGADRCLAWPLAGPTSKSPGTWDMIRKAQAAGIETEIHPV